jgi:hypothetical protein
MEGRTMRKLSLVACLILWASDCLAGPLVTTVQIFNGAPGNTLPTTPVAGSPQSVIHPTMASATLAFPASPTIGLGTGLIAEVGGLNLYNRSTIGFSQGGVAALEIPGSFRVLTTTEGIIVREALAGDNDLTLNIINLALAVYDPAQGAQASIQAVIDVTWENGFQSYAISATLTNGAGGVTSFAEDAPIIIGDVTSIGPNFSTLDGRLYTSPAFAVTFHLGDLGAGSPIVINYAAITTAISPNAPSLAGFQQVRAQFGDPDNPSSSDNNTNVRLTPGGVVQEVPEPTSVVGWMLCGLLGLLVSRRQAHC